MRLRLAVENVAEENELSRGEGTLGANKPPHRREKIETKILLEVKSNKRGTNNASPTCGTSHESPASRTLILFSPCSLRANLFSAFGGFARQRWADVTRHGQCR